MKISKELEKTCPEGYPWECGGCMRKNGSTIPCSGREKPKTIKMKTKKEVKMKNFKFNVFTTVEVEAENEDEACEKMIEVVRDMGARDFDFEIE